MSQFRCHRCGKMSNVSDLFCSQACKDGRAADLAAATTALEGHGFTAEPNAPNVWTSGGVSVTLEEVIHFGIDETIARHAAYPNDPLVSA